MPGDLGKPARSHFFKTGERRTGIMDNVFTSEHASHIEGGHR